MNSFFWNPQDDAERIQSILLSDPRPKQMGTEFWVAVAGAVSIFIALAFGVLK
jgi:hypothetical protein